MIRKILLASGLFLAAVSLGCSGPEHKPPKPHPGAQVPMKGFSLRLSNGGSLRVNCGEESMKGCIDAAKPLLDRLDGVKKPGSKTSG